jgi:surface protein
MAKTVKIPLKEIAEKAADKELSGYKVGVKPTIQYEGGDGIKISFSGNSQLTSLSFTSAFNGAIPNITNMSNMFYNCNALTSLNLSSFDTSKVNDMSYMFYNCNALTSLNLSSFDTSKVTNMNSMFASCRALTSLNLSSFDTSKVTNMSSMFYGCYALTSLRFPSNKSFDISSTRLVHDGLVVLLNDLKSVTTTQTLTMGSEKLALLSDAEKKIATDKGWTLA